MNEESAVDRIRRGYGEPEQHLIDEFAAGRVSRRELLRRGSVLGLSLPTLGLLLGACGSANSTSNPKPSGKSGGTITVALGAPTGAINPLTVADTGGANMLAQTGEFLTYCDQEAVLHPQLATSWKASHGATVWTFKIRSGVKFHDGRTMTADDVVYSLKIQCDPKGDASALSNFKGVLVPSGIQKLDDHTVRFELQSPNGNFPYLVSSDNYNVVIMPNGYDPHKWQSSFIGTGPFLLDKYNVQTGASFRRNPHYWGMPAKLASTAFAFYSDQQAEVLALQGGSVNVIQQVVYQGAQAVLTNEYTVINIKSSGHRELSMRTDEAPFNDARVRRAIALTLDRPALVNALLHGYGQVGNDNPFAPVFPSTDKSVPQRTQNLAEAKQLLAQAGHPNGFKTKMYVENILECANLAQVVQSSAAKIGVHIDLVVESESVYEGKSVYGQSDWLDGIMSLVAYVYRAVPNVFLESPLESHGPWNAARFKDSTYDKLVREYVADADLQSQRATAGKIQRLLLEETPIIIPYFPAQLAVTTRQVTGVEFNGQGTTFLQHASVA